MAHYAFINDANIVTEVIVGRDENEGVDWESFYAEVRGQRCLRTSYNTLGGKRPDGTPGYRLNYAGIGMLFRDDIDGFIPPCPGEDFVLDESTGTWAEA